MGLEDGGQDDESHIIDGSHLSVGDWVVTEDTPAQLGLRRLKQRDIIEGLKVYMWALRDSDAEAGKYYPCVIVKPTAPNTNGDRFWLKVEEETPSWPLDYPPLSAGTTIPFNQHTLEHLFVRVNG